MRLNFVVVGSFVGFYIDVLVLSDFLYVFSEFCLEIICCDAVDFKVYFSDDIEHVVFKFIEGAYMRYRWWRCLGSVKRRRLSNAFDV